MAPDTIEIFVRELDGTDAATWLRERFDDLNEGDQGPTITFHATDGDATVPVQVAVDVQNGPYTSVWFRGGDLPWDSTTSCARDAHEALGKDVICYPDQSDDPWQMVRFVDGTEERVDERQLAF